jgi:hypothetical protein
MEDGDGGCESVRSTKAEEDIEDEREEADTEVERFGEGGAGVVIIVAVELGGDAVVKVTGVLRPFVTLDEARLGFVIDATAGSEGSSTTDVIR